MSKGACAQENFTQLGPAWGLNTLSCSESGDVFNQAIEGTFCCVKKDDTRVSSWGNQCQPKEIDNGLAYFCAGHPLTESGIVTTDLNSPYRNIMGHGVQDTVGRAEDSIDIYPEWVLYPLKAGLPAT